MKVEGKQFGGELGRELAGLLKVYQSSTDAEWSALDKKHKANEALQRAVGSESAKFGRRVRRELKDLRPGWRVDQASLSIGVNHAEKPFIYHIDVVIELGYYDDWERGSVRMTCSIDKADKMIAELRSCFCLEGGA
jgi:hypothetical protein